MTRSGWAWRLYENRSARLGLIMIVLIAGAGLLAPVVTPVDPLDTDISSALNAPSFDHLFGTDELGRDMLVRMLYGIRMSLLIGILSVSLGVSVGTLAGLVAGYREGWTQRVIMRATDIMLAFPNILMAIVIITVLGPGLGSVIVAVGIASIPAYIRVVRGVTLSLKEQDFVEGARAVGCTPATILFRYILPNAASPIIVLSTLGMATTILSAAGLSFLGLGAQPPTPELGAMLAGGRSYLFTGAWWVTLVPGVAIVAICLGVNLLGDGLRDVLDPRLRL